MAVIDETGKKKAVLIALSLHGELCEDFLDQSIAREREREPRESLKEVKLALRSR